MKTRHQNGYLYRKDGWWYLRHYDNVLQDDGSIQRTQLARKIAPVCERYSTKRDVRPLADEALLPVNSGAQAVESTMRLGRFVTTIYLPWAKMEKRPSTYKSYKDIWENHLKPRCGEVWLRDLRTCHAQRLLADIARDNDLTRSSLFHIKSVLSAVFKHAKRVGALDGVNPVQDVAVPTAREGADTHAYSLEEIMQMMAVMPLAAATAIGFAGFTGLRHGEIRGALWDNYDGQQLFVTQSVWNRHVTPPKRQKSKAPVPVIAPLAYLLNMYRESVGKPNSGYIFAGATGQPMNLHNLAERVIRPKLKGIGIEWHGWHAFRRGLATNLNRLAVPDKTIQSILRHADLSTTMNSYVKSVAADSRAAMVTLENLICTKYAPMLAKVGTAAGVN